MSLLLTYASLGCVAAGLIIGGVALAVGHDVRVSLGTALDFWLAAGLLGLGTAPGWQPLLTAATIIAIRQLVNASLRRRPGHPAGTLTAPRKRNGSA